MKVLLVEPFAHMAGGYPVYARCMSQLLAETGVDGTLLTFQGFSDDDSDMPIDHYSVLSDIGFWVKPLRILLRFLNFVALFRPLICPLQTSVTFTFALRWDKRREYDVIHFLDTSTVSFLFLTFASMVKNRNLILTFHGVPREHYSKNWRKDFAMSLKTRSYYHSFCLLLTKLSTSGLIINIKKFLYHRAIKKNHLAFVCHAREEQEAYAKCVFSHSVNFVPEARPKPPPITRQESRQYLQLPEESWVFLIFGINHGHKDYEVIFKAVQGLPKNFQLVFAGKVLSEDAMKNNPRQLATNYGLKENTIVVDKFIPESEKRYYFYAADALILSYHKGFSQQSGNLLDACQYGLPAIATDDKQIGEWVKSYKIGLTFVPEDSSSMQKAISDFINLSDEEKREMRNHMLEFGESARSWEQMKRGYIDLYQKLMKEEHEA